MANELKAQEDIDVFVGMFSLLKEYGAPKAMFMLKQFSPSAFLLIKDACNKMPDKPTAALLKA